MAFDKVDTQVDFPAQERAVLEFWERNQTFERLRAKNRGKPKWSFLDGPITANNPMGVHHAWGRTYKDAYQRYFAMTGHEERYQNGFDCQGLWVEVEVEKELKLQSKRDIENLVPGDLFASIDKFVRLCKERVDRYAKVQTEQSVRLGYWMDWDRGEDWQKPPDQRRSYFTMSEENNYTIWSFLKKCHERKLIYQGYDAMPWCPRCAVGLSQMEMSEGYQFVAHRAVFVRFPLRDRPGENLLIWTTTPWTLSSNVAAAVNPNLAYLKVKLRDQVYYLAKGAYTAKRLEEQFKRKEWVEGVPKLRSLEQIFKEKAGKDKVEVIGEISGKEMVGWQYDGPFDELPAQANLGGFPPHLAETVLQRNWAPNRSAKDVHRVVQWDMVGETEGTGIVHIAPGCGKEDFQLGKWLQRLSILKGMYASETFDDYVSTEDGTRPSFEQLLPVMENYLSQSQEGQIHADNPEGLPPIAPLNDEGRFLPGFGPLEGRSAVENETTDFILANLKEKGVLLDVERYPHSYPHCWRCKTELLFRLVDEWFINMGWREEIMDVVRQVTFLPKDINGQARELDWLKNMGDWMISKKRFWGLALPIWRCEKCGHFDVIGSREELRLRAVEGWDRFDGHSPHRPWVDLVKIKCEKCGGSASRIGDVGNPWLDAGIVPYSTMGYNRDPRYWEQWFPADFITECFPGQFRNWFYAILAMSTMMEGRPPFKVLLGHALVRDERGEEMHKSKGNAIPFNEAADKMGADLMRWMFCRQNPSSNINFGYGPAEEVRSKFILKLWNTYAFFSNYARLDSFDPNAPQVPVKDRPDIDRWILSDLQLLVKKAREAFESYNVMAFCLEAENFVDDRLSNWYVRRNRRRFWKNEKGADKLAAYQTLYTALVTLARLFAPIMPFLTETLYRNLVAGDEGRSVHLCDYPLADESLIDEELSAEMEALLRIVSLGSAARNSVKIKVRQPLAEMKVQGDDLVRKAVERFGDQVRDELNIRKVTFQDVSEGSLLQADVKPNMKTLGPKFGPRLKEVQNTIAVTNPIWLAEKVQAGQLFELPTGGDPVMIEPSDLVTQLKAPEGWAGAADWGIQVVVNTQISEDLRLDGLAREVVRHVQSARKDAGLEMEDRIELYLGTDDADLRSAIDKHGRYIAAETLVVKWSEKPLGSDAFTANVKVDGKPLTIHLRKT